MCVLSLCCLQVSEDHSSFATWSNDGTVKLFDCVRMQSKSVTNRSRLTYNRQEGHVRSITFCQNSASIAAVSEKNRAGSIHVFRIDNNTSGQNVLEERELDVVKDGVAVDVTYMDAGAQNVLIYANVHGSIIGWDLRSPAHSAWKLQNKLKLGLITSLDVSPSNCWMAVGTSHGAIICWDLRFQLPVSTIIHPTNRRVRRILATAHAEHAQSGVITSMQSNNEISFWDLETHARQRTIWASITPPLSQQRMTRHSFNGIFFERNESDTFLLSAGSDMRIRYWDLKEPGNSHVVVPAAKDDMLRPHTTTYNSQVIDGTQVLAETYGDLKTDRRDPEAPVRGYDSPRAGHHDVITDLNMCKPSQCLIITSSRDGVVKVWK